MGNECYFYDVKKEKSIATFYYTTDYSSDDSVTIDFSNGEVRNNGVKINSFISFCENNTFYADFHEKNNCFNNCIRHIFRKNHFHIANMNWSVLSVEDRLIVLEKYWNYFDIIDPTVVLPDHIDNNFAIWCRNIHKRFSEENYTIYKYLQKVKQETSGNDAKRLENILKVVDLNAFKLIMENDELKRAIFSIITISNKNFETWREDLYIILSKAIDNDLDLVSILDVTKSVEKNRTIVNNFVNEIEKKKIANNLQKLNALEEIIKDEKYCVVVPQNVEDLANEGQQQNNCVGTYYNEEIADGEQYIYFIREKSNPTKSFITCRFSECDDETVEYRTRFNHAVCDLSDSSHIMNLIEKIDTEIRHILSAL